MKTMYAKILGHGLGDLIKYVISTLPFNIQKDFKEGFLRELDTYNFTPNKDLRPNQTHTNTLDGIAIDEFDIPDPQHTAILVKAFYDFCYNKSTAKRMDDEIRKRLEE